jgi:hypothetical protein
MRTSFKLLGYYWHGNRSKAKRWLRRCKKQGFHGVRVFGETHFWNWETQNVFWGLPPRLEPYDLGYNGAPSQWKLKQRHQKVLRQFIEDLVDFDMIAELSNLATLKAHEPKYGDLRKDCRDVVGYNSHALRVTAEYLNSIDASNLIYELYNEIDVEGCRIPGYEFQEQFMRWKNRDLPGSLVGVSNGRSWDPSPLVGPTHYNIHTSRGHQWWKIGDEITKLRDKTKQRPIFLNENMPYGTIEQKERWGWGNRVTHDWVRLQMQWNEAYNMGVSYCVHDLTGCLTDPDIPESPMEAAHREQFGEGGSPPPPPPPPPPDITTGPIEAHRGEWDSSKIATYEVEFPTGLLPVTLEGDGNKVARPKPGPDGSDGKGMLNCRYSVDLGHEFHLETITAMLLRGKKTKWMSLEVYDHGGNLLGVCMGHGVHRLNSVSSTHRYDIRLSIQVEDGETARHNVRLFLRGFDGTTQSN